MKCEKCAAEMKCEELNEQTRKYRCAKCGLTEIRDHAGRKLLQGQADYRGKALLG